MKKKKICQMCFEVEANPNDSLCQECADAEMRESIAESLEEMIEELDD
jgi:NMD protein affecting ribosome stability and mRNA decay